MLRNPVRRWLVVTLTLGLAACSSKPSPTEQGPGGRTNSGMDCQPEPRAPGACGDNGCGLLHACEGDDAGKVCNAQYHCVDTGACTDTCETAGWECGILCNASCSTNPDGSCSSGTCIWGHCFETPVEHSCADCRLSLHVIERQGEEVKLGIDYDSKQGPLPRMFDLRIYSNFKVTVVDAIVGTALQNAGKELYADPLTSNRWRDVGTRTFGLLALSLSNVNLIESGRLAEVKFNLSNVPTGVKVAFQLQQRSKSFAPINADQALQSERYDQAVVVEH